MKTPMRWTCGGGAMKTPGTVEHEPPMIPRGPRMLYDPIINRLCTIFPACFSRLDPKPLKIGLGAELLALAGAHPIQPWPT